MQHFFFLLFSLFLLFAFTPQRGYACGQQCCAKKEMQKGASVQKCCCASGKTARRCHKGSAKDCNGKCGGHCACSFSPTAVFLPAEEMQFRLSATTGQQERFAYLPPTTSGIHAGVWLPPNFLV